MFLNIPCCPLMAANAPAPRASRRRKKERKKEIRPEAWIKETLPRRDAWGRSPALFTPLMYLMCTFCSPKRTPERQAWHPSMPFPTHMASPPRLQHRLPRTLISQNALPQTLVHTLACSTGCLPSYLDIPTRPSAHTHSHTLSPAAPAASYLGTPHTLPTSTPCSSFSCPAHPHALLTRASC